MICILDNAIAYVARIPWTENGSIRGNILFGLPLDLSRYQKVLFATGLRRDLEILSDGEQTDIGVNGINLSCGQRARVSLTRALYSRAGTLLMDDIFSALMLKLAGTFIPDFETAKKDRRGWARHTSRDSRRMWPRNALLASLQTLGRNAWMVVVNLDERKNLEEIRSQQELIIGLLLEHGVDVNQADGCTRAPLRIAVQHCSTALQRACCQISWCRFQC